MNDDFFIDDILNCKKRKKSLNSKKKGNRGELEVCKILSARFPNKDNFFRVVGSGNRYSQVKLSEAAKHVLTSDLVCPTDFKYVIEVKCGYAEIELCDIFNNGNKKLDGFLVQVEKDATSTNKQPLLIWKKSRHSWLVFLKCDVQSDYKLHYRNWCAISLDQLLLLPDSFFFN